MGTSPVIAEHPLKQYANTFAFLFFENNFCGIDFNPQHPLKTPSKLNASILLSKRFSGILYKFEQLAKHCKK